MPRLSKLLEKLEDTADARLGVWFRRYKKKTARLYLDRSGGLVLLWHDPQLHAPRHRRRTPRHRTGCDRHPGIRSLSQLVGGVFRLQIYKGSTRL